MLDSLGLGGDGDEIDAIGRVEARFGIALDPSACGRFETVGDVWQAVAAQLRDDEAGHGWRAFVEALASETLTRSDHDKVGPETRLLAPGAAEQAGKALKRLFRR